MGISIPLGLGLQRESATYNAVSTVAVNSGLIFLMDVFKFRDELVSDYECFSRSFTRIRAIGGGVSVSVAKNSEGSYEVTVNGGRVASFGRWCGKIWFSEDEYDTGCLLDETEWE